MKLTDITKRLLPGSDKNGKDAAPPAQTAPQSAQPRSAALEQAQKALAEVVRMRKAKDVKYSHKAALELLKPHYDQPEVRQGDPNFRFEFASTLYMLAAGQKSLEKRTALQQAALSDFIKIRSNPSAQEELRVQAGISAAGMLVENGHTKEAEQAMRDVNNILNPEGTPKEKRRGHTACLVAVTYSHLKANNKDRVTEGYNKIPETFTPRFGVISSMYNQIEGFVLSPNALHDMPTAFNTSADPNDTSVLGAVLEPEASHDGTAANIPLAVEPEPGPGAAAGTGSKIKHTQPINITPEKPTGIKPAADTKPPAKHALPPLLSEDEPSKPKKGDGETLELA